MFHGVIARALEEEIHNIRVRVADAVRRGPGQVQNLREIYDAVQSGPCQAKIINNPTTTLSLSHDHTSPMTTLSSQDEYNLLSQNPQSEP